MNKMCPVYNQKSTACQNTPHHEVRGGRTLPNENRCHTKPVCSQARCRLPSTQSCLAFATLRPNASQQSTLSQCGYVNTSIVHQLLRKPTIFTCSKPFRRVTMSKLRSGVK
ncbi:hypothetical protein B5X24_HaOG204674 [Helicoverpa armigera]|uniref:Uncharacterized protein n=1 Tax=Helicoverpa armigera TaxID=29058 RepID=A0A2W1BS38_HELAM|nr:hypothetical protein B5X24_HaOG204674 [Helicoverpa armigera]